MEPRYNTLGIFINLHLHVRFRIMLELIRKKRSFLRIECNFKMFRIVLVAQFYPTEITQWNLT